MATIVKDGVRYRAQVYVKGVRQSKTFDTKTEAKDWAKRREFELMDAGPTARMTVSELVEKWCVRYAFRTNIYKEEQRLKALTRGDFGQLLLSDLTKVEVAKWRDDRLKQVQAGTTLREFNLLSAMFSLAVDEMGLLPENPFRGVKRPVPPAPRSRIASNEDLERLEIAATLRPSGAIALRMFQLGIQTGMSVGELSKLTHDQIDRAKKIIRLPEFKTRPAREVPLTKAALGLIGEGEGSVFGVRARNIDANWRDLCDAAAVDDLHFHDSRHMAATWMAAKIPAVALAKLLGHHNLKQLLHTYYKEDASLLVEKLEN